MMEDKRAWAKSIEELLKSEKRSDVASVDYSVESRNGWNREVVLIKFRSGGSQKINVSGNSLGSILHEIVREVYGHGAIGRIYDEY